MSMKIDLNSDLGEGFGGFGSSHPGPLVSRRPSRRFEVALAERDLRPLPRRDTRRAISEHLDDFLFRAASLPHPAGDRPVLDDLVAGLLATVMLFKIMKQNFADIDVVFVRHFNLLPLNMPPIRHIRQNNDP